MTMARNSEKVERRIFIETPEQIQFAFELAGPGTRMMAYLIDLGIRSVVLAILSLVILGATGMVLPELATGLVLMLMFVLEWGYHTFFEWIWHGSTPGKRAMKIRVLRTNGVSIDFVRSAMRNLLRAADVFPFGYATAFLVMFVSKSERRLGDFAADVMVVREDRVLLRDLPPLPQESLSLPRGSSTLLGLKQRDLSLIDDFFRRRNYFLPDRSLELASILAKPIGERFRISTEEPRLLLAGILRESQDTKSSGFKPSKDSGAFR